MSLRTLGAAVRFLTILPVPGISTTDELERAPIWFPLVGVFIGAVTAAGDLAGARCGIPSAVLCVLTVALLGALSGGLHLDGLADTADGFLSVRPRERVLEIMRDSRIGTMGVLALAFVLGLKTTGLLHLAGALRWRTIVLAPLAGRVALVVTLCVLPYARGEGGGLAAAFVRRRQVAPALCAVMLLTAFAPFVLGSAGLGLVAVVLGATALLGAWTKRRIGGFTGDTLGATSELIEAVVFVFVACR